MAEKPMIPDFPDLPDFGQMITQACEVIASVRGIPYDFNGALSLENKFVVLFKTVKEMFDTQDELVKSYKALYDFVNQFFANLDLQENVNVALEKMIDDGTLPELISKLLLDNSISIDLLGCKSDFFNFTSVPPVYTLYPENQNLNENYTDNSDIINNAIIKLYNDGGGTLIVPPGYYGIKKPIILKNNVRIIGSGFSSSYLCTNENIKCFVDITNSGGTTVKDISLLQNKANTNNQTHGISSDTSEIGTYPMYNHYNTLQNIFIYNCGGNGLNINSGYLANINNIHAMRCYGYGFYINVTDITLNNIYAWECECGALCIEKEYVHINGGKFFYNGSYLYYNNDEVKGKYSVVMHGGRCTLENIDVQDNYRNGIYIGGYDNILNSVIIDACGVTAKYQKRYNSVFDSYSLVINAVSPNVENCIACNYIQQLDATLVQTKFVKIENIQYGNCILDIKKTGYATQISGGIELHTPNLVTKILKNTEILPYNSTTELVVTEQTTINKTDTNIILTSNSPFFAFSNELFTVTKSGLYIFTLSGGVDSGTSTTTSCIFTIYSTTGNIVSVRTITGLEKGIHLTIPLFLNAGTYYGIKARTESGTLAIGQYTSKIIVNTLLN